MMIYILVTAICCYRGRDGTLMGGGTTRNMSSFQKNELCNVASCWTYLVYWNTAFEFEFQGFYKTNHTYFNKFLFKCHPEDGPTIGSKYVAGIIN